GILANTPRSGFFFLGSGKQSVAEHVNRMTYVGYALSKMAEADTEKVLKMCMFHDFAEARTSDLNYVHQKYVKADEEKAINDATENIFFGKDIQNVFTEFEKQETKEALLAKDADHLEFILSLKEQLDIGNTRAEDWISKAIKRLKTNEAKELAKTILETASEEWWFGNKEDEWWISKNKLK
ncbi:MAG: HD domain-containing protein, partial [Nanoarchaeota archaeon]|nr:HD domain-containing protein [Nanoarchaeota archaeon]